jgi:hypothetical protein
MKNFFIIIFCSILNITVFAQLTTLKVDGGTVVTKLGMGISVNTGSTLNRDWIIINDAKCPLQLDKVGINTIYGSSRYYFKPTGNIIPSEHIVAYDIYHILYDVFGKHMKSLSNLDVSELTAPTELGKSGSWYASENDVKEYFLCVSYVANVRTKEGVIWRYNPEDIKEVLSKIQIAYEDGYSPSNDEKEK